MKNALFVTTVVITALLIDSDVSGFRLQTFDKNLKSSFTRQSSDSKPRAMGGTKVKPGEIPWIVSIHYRMKEDPDAPMQHNCGGAILDTEHIVTAGHCVWNKSISDMAIIAGANNIKKKEESQQRRKIARFYLHPKYTAGDRPGPYDIAVIQIEKAFNFNKYVTKIEVSKCNETGFGKKCFYAGWGNMLPVSAMFYQGSEELMQGDTSIIKKKECKEAYVGFDEELNTAVCAKAGVLHGTCQGDSGGPLICFRKKRKDPYLAGVVSFGFPVCNDGYHPDVYTDLGHKKICNYCTDYERIVNESANSTDSADNNSSESSESTDSPNSSTNSSSK